MTPDGIVLCDDLIFVSRITGTAKAAGLSVTWAKSAGMALDQTRRTPPKGVIVDLHTPGLDVPALLAELREACPAMPRVIAFGSHVDVETLKAARKAGCDRVMPRSQFVEELEACLKDWLA